jgi:hypothetical protein
MRTWRVGTISMGASLLLLGILLLLSQWMGYDVMNIMMSWWPFILIVLGLEILVFFFVTRQEKPFLKYDFLSIFFIGVLGMVGIGFAVLSSTGIIDKVEEMLAREEKTFQLPEYSRKVGPDVKRIVVQTDRYPITIEGTDEKEVSMFGTYRAWTGDKEELVKKPEDYLSVQQKGDSLYVNVISLPSETGLFDRFATLNATLLVPMNVNLEVIGQDNPITLKPRTLMSDWSVDSASDVLVHLQKNSDVLLSAIGVQELHSANHQWHVAGDRSERAAKEGAEQEFSEEPYQNGTFKVGKGTHSLQIMNAFRVSLSTVQ